MSWAGLADKLIVVSTARLTREAREWLTQNASLVERPNYGHDFVSYQVGLASADLRAFDEVVICNDSFVGPLRPYSQIFAEMENQPCDFWGFTSCRRTTLHVQSFFVVFRSWVVRSLTFNRFWSELVALSDRKQVIRRYEVGMSASLIDAGFAAGTYFKEDQADTVLARRRMEWWAAHRPPGVTLGSIRSGLLRTRAAEWWNPAIALPDRALQGGRLPYVKIDTLRYDPYALDSDKLLSECESLFPHEFDGVRDYLRRTADSYPRRLGEELLHTPLLLRPVASSVRYGR